MSFFIITFISIYIYSQNFYIPLSKWGDTKSYGNMLVALSTEYNDALLVIENANIGWAVIQQVIDKHGGIDEEKTMGFDKVEVIE